MSPRLPIAARFWILLAVMATAVAGMGLVAVGGLSNLHSGAEGLHDRLVMNAIAGEGRFHLGDLRASLPLYVATPGEARRRELRGRIEEDLLHLGEHEHHLLDTRQRAAVATVAALWRSGAFDGAAADRSARRAGALLDPISDALDEAGEDQLAAAASARARADSDYDHTRAGVVAVLLGTMVLGIGMVLWLVRTVVPRTRAYARFAEGVSTGRAAGRLRPEGTDELADLGRTLDVMVERHEAERAYQSTQQEFADAMQVTTSEDEAHAVLKRHVERTVADSLVVVLNRNNSDDRLEATTPVEASSPLVEGLDGAAPRSCLAVRFARRHQEGGDLDPLMSCEVCGKAADMVTCDPLLVGGEVIGSVNVAHEAPLDDAEDKRLRDTVGQAAPVLANLRNLAIAELRASTDALTGLPNARSVQDTLKRMVAQAARAQAPLAALLLDLDHFKQINDTYGHDRGDEVLAAAAEAMRSAVRTSDFVGRYGGEEFLLLLPDTDADGAWKVAEDVRAAVAAVALPTVDREVTASLGVAMLGDDGLDGEGLLRSADRALYAAKSLGRNRVALAGTAPALR